MIKPSVLLILLGLITLTFVERPAWMFDAGPAASNATLYPVSGLPVLSRATDASLEILCLAVLVVDALCSSGAQGRAILFFGGWRNRKIVYLLILATAVVEAAASAAGVWHQSLLRAAPFLRLGLLVLQSTTLLSQLELMRRTLPQVACSGSRHGCRVESPTISWPTVVAVKECHPTMHYGGYDQWIWLLTQPVRCSRNCTRHLADSKLTAAAAIVCTGSTILPVLPNMIANTCRCVACTLPH